MRRSPAYIETPQIRRPPVVNISHQNIRGVHSKHTQNFIYPSLKCKWPIHTKLLAPNDLISLSYRTQYCVRNDNVYYELKKNRLKYLSATRPVLEDFLGFLKVSLSRHNECGSTSVVSAIDYCEVQMCLSMKYVLILQHYLRLLASCCNPTNHLKQMPTRDEYTLQILKSPRMTVTYNGNALIQQMSMEKGQTNESLCGKYTEHLKKKKYDQPKFFLFHGFTGGLCTKTILIWDGINHLAVTLLIRRRHPRSTN